MSKYGFLAIASWKCLLFRMSCFVRTYSPSILRLSLVPIIGDVSINAADSKPGIFSLKKINGSYNFSSSINFRFGEVFNFCGA